MTRVNYRRLQMKGFESANSFFEKTFKETKAILKGLQRDSEFVTATCTSDFRSNIRKQIRRMNRLLRYQGIHFSSKVQLLETRNLLRGMVR